MSRYRYRTNHLQADVSFEGLQLEPLYSDANGLRSRIVRTESMLDVKSPSGYRVANGCTHLKKDSAVVSGEIVYSTTTKAMPYKVRQLALMETREELSPSDLYATVPWADLVSDMSRQVDGKLQTKSLLPVTLKELATTYRMVTNPFGLLKRDWRSTAGTLTASGLAKKGANLWLEGRYGWGAGYYDLKQFSASTRKLHASITKAGLSTEGRGFSYTARWKNTLDVPPPSISDAEWQAWIESDSWSNNNGGLARVKYTSRTLRAYLSAHAADPVVPSYNTIQRFCQAYGLTVDHILPILWEIVPYSFVVDWFINVNGVMAYSDYRKLEQERLQRVCHSIKMETEYVTEFCPGKCWSGGFYDTFYPRFLSGSGGKTTMYYRCVDLPTSSAILKGDSLTLTQLLSGGALLLQRLIR